MSPIRSFEDVLHHEYKIIMIKDSAFVEMMRNARPGSGMYRYYHEFVKDTKEDIWVEENEQGNHRILTEEKTLYFTGHLAQMASRDVTALKMIDAIKSYLGWAFKENSELTDFFSYHSFSLYETGLRTKTVRVRTPFFFTGVEDTSL